MLRTEFCLLFDIASLVVPSLELGIMFFEPVDNSLQIGSYYRKMVSKVGVR